MKKIYTTMMTLLLGAVASSPLMAENAVFNETTQTGYDKIQDAINAVADNDILVVNEDITVGTRINFNDKTFTLKGKTGSESLIREKSGYMMFLLGSGTVTIENLTVDGSNISVDKDDFEASHGGTANLNNVIFKNCDHSANTTRIMTIKNSQGYATVNLTDVKFVDCKLSENIGGISIQNNGQAHLNIAGDNAISVQFDGTKRIDNATDLTNTTPIDLYVADNRAYGNALVLNTKDITKFRIANNINGCVYPKASGNELQYFEASACNETTNTGWYTITDAINYAASENVISLLKDCETEGNISVSAKNITINGAYTVSRSTVTGNTLTLTKGNRLFLVNEAGTLSLNNITCDGNDNTRNGSFLEAAGNGETRGTINMTDVELKNFNSTHNQGIVAVKNSAIANLKNVTITNCSVPENRGEVFVGNNNVSISGDNSFSMLIEKTNHVNASDLTNVEPLTIIAENTAEGRGSIVNGVDSADNFSVLDATGTPVDVKVDNGSIVLGKADDTTAIETIESDDVNAPVEYFNIQGVRVENPENGLYIKRQGSKVTKVIL